MGLNQSKDAWENPVDNVEATLYYFAGRGLGDQVRWMLAATNVSFTQKIISKRSQLLKMAQRQLPFGEIPLLQIDGQELVQSQVMIRYLAKRGGLTGFNEEEQLKCDMIAEAVNDLINLVASAPFKRCGPTIGLILPSDNPIPETSTNASLASKSIDEEIKVLESIPTTSSLASTDTASSSSSSPIPNPPNPSYLAHLANMKRKWAYLGARFEAILRANNQDAFPLLPIKPIPHHTPPTTSASTTNNTPLARDYTAVPNRDLYLVGQAFTYADVLVAHVTTWFVEECGVEIVQDMPNVVMLQNQIISLPSIKAFIQSAHYFPKSDQKYVDTVRKVLGRNIT